MIIYKATNKVNGRLYIGQTSCTLDERIQKHISQAKAGGGFIFAKALRKYGSESFEWEILSEHPDQEALDAAEIEAIEWFNAIGPKGYNIREGGSRGPHTAETLKQISEKLKGKPLSEEHKQKISAALKGRKRPPEVVAKIGRKKGFKYSEESKTKQKETWKKKRGEGRSPKIAKAASKYWKGRKRGPLSEEHKEKISQKRKQNT